jgi:nitroreductase
MAETMDFFEAIYSQRSLRYLKENPVPNEMIKKIIDAGIRAPNGGNAQDWAFVVIKDSETKRKMAPLYAGTARPDNYPPPRRNRRSEANPLLIISRPIQQRSQCGFWHAPSTPEQTSPTVHQSIQPCRICC